MKKITYVLDTNVLLDNPNIISSLHKQDVVIPYKVLEELDKHKYSPGLKGLNARDASRFLSALLDNNTETTTLKTGIKLEHGGKLFVRSHKDFDLPDLSEDTADDCIVKVAVGTQTIDKKNVVMMTNDILVKIKSNSCGLKTMGSDSNADLQSSKDLFTGIKHVPVDKETIEVFYQNKGKESEFPILPKKLTKEKLHINEYVVLTNEEVDIKKKPYALLRFDGHKLIYVNEKKLSGGKVKSLNLEQTCAIDLLLNENIPLVTLTGKAGSGKTLITLAAALDQVVDYKLYQNVVIIRPMEAVGKEIGFLPGMIEEKLAPWFEPIKDNLRFILSDGNDNGKKSKTVDYNIKMMLENGTIEMDAMTFIRGRSISNAFMIIDESQNISEHEAKTILTRVGKGTKIVLIGDTSQTDRKDVDSISNGLSVVLEKFKQYGLSGHVTLNTSVRSDIAELAATIL